MSASSVDLPAPFGTQDAGALTRGDAPLDAADGRLVGAGKVTPTSSRSTTSLPSRAVAVFASATVSRMRRDVVDQGVGRVDAELRLARAGRGTAAEPGELLARQVLPTLLARRGLPVTLDALQDVGRVAALEGLDDAVVHLPRVGRHLVEEPPVVRHDDEPALVRRPAPVEVLREPLRCPRRRGGWSARRGTARPSRRRAARERHAPALAAGQVVDRASHGMSRTSPPITSRIFGVARPLVLRRGRRRRLRRRSRPRASVVGLVEHADGHAAAAGDAAGVGFEASGEQAQQGRLAVAVPADDADAVALVDADGDAVEDGAGGEFEMQVLGAEEMCHPSRVGGAGAGSARGGGVRRGLRLVRGCPHRARSCRRTERPSSHRPTARAPCDPHVVPTDSREARLSSPTPARPRQTGALRGRRADGDADGRLKPLRPPRGPRGRDGQLRSTPPNPRPPARSRRAAIR